VYTALRFLNYVLSCTILAVALSPILGFAQSAPPANSVSSATALQQLQAADNPLLGSVPSGKVDPNPVSLTLLDAIDRGLKYNLGIVLSQQGNNTAAAERLRSFSSLLPNVSARIADSSQQINLAAYGFPVAPGQSPIIGPFNVFDARALVSQNVLDFNAINKVRAADANVSAAKFSYQNARDLVVLAVGATYLQALANQSRVEAAQAEFNTATATYKQAVDQKKAGVIPGIDVLRAQVDMQARQQRLVVAQNDLDKQLLQVGRVIGLPPAQSFVLADKIPAPAPLEITLDLAIQRAFDARSDYKQAEALMRAAERTKAAAQAERLPTVGFQGDFGTIGQSPTSNHETYTAAVAARIPIFEGGRIKADIQAADAILNQRKSQYEDMRGRIEYEVRSAFFDYEAATKQLQVATSNLDLARQQLQQAQDRFASGVTNNLEVVQAQEAEATAAENYISSLFGHNFSKLAVARAIGVTEDATKRFLGGKH
jgi:outer membrane protein TolC